MAKMRVKSGCRYMVKNVWYSAGDIVEVADGVNSPKLEKVAKGRAKAKPKAAPKADKVESVL